MPPSLAERLRKAGIRHYDELIHDQPREWLLKNFKAEGSAPTYPVNVSRLMRNLVWQMKERVAAGEKPFSELAKMKPAPKTCGPPDEDCQLCPGADLYDDISPPSPED